MAVIGCMSDCMLLLEKTHISSYHLLKKKVTFCPLYPSECIVLEKKMGQITLVARSLFVLVWYFLIIISYFEYLHSCFCKTVLHLEYKLAIDQFYHYTLLHTTSYKTISSERTRLVCCASLTRNLLLKIVTI
jgi:hypothetical protein